MADTTLDIDLIWEDQPGDGSLCGCCKEPIFYKMFAMAVVSGPEKSATNRKLCESCNNALNK